MLASWAKIVYRKPWHVLILTLLLIVLGGIYGFGVFSRLSTGNDFQDPNAASTQVENLSLSKFSGTQGQLIVLLSSTQLQVHSPAFDQAAQKDLAAIARQPHVIKVLSYYNSGESRLVSINHHATYADVALSGNSKQQQQVFDNLVALFAKHSSGLQVRLGGNIAVSVQINQQVTSDLKRAESLSFPVVAILLILIFGNVVAATVPLFLGGLSILGALFITRVLTNFTSMSVYVINVITLLGLGLAIDYSLFLVGRFREELALSGNVETALTTTITKAGRTVMFSGSTVILSLLSLIVFPEVFLRSMGMSGAAVVATAALLSLTVVPASLRLLGRHINDLSLPGRNAMVKPRPHEAKKGFWYVFSQFIMRRPVVVLVVTLAVLLGVGSQFLHAKLSNPDTYSVPTNLSSRQVNDSLSRNFSNTSTEPINILVHTTGNPLESPNLRYLTQYISRLKAIKGVTQVDSLIAHLPPRLSGISEPNGTTLLSVPSFAPILSQYVSGNYDQLTVFQAYGPQSTQAQQLIQTIRALPTPRGFTPEVGGVSAELVDLLHSLRTHIPYSLAIIFCATIVLIFLLMGGILVPIKAIILGIISLSAAFGILVWVFQDHHLAGALSLAALGSVDATSAVLIFAIAFGLSMDYEFFLLSRIKEEYEATGDNTHAVAHGVQKTAGIITSAALLLISVIGLFATSKISLIQQIGLGLGSAVAIDSTLVRMVLVPATMRLLGRANWWAPKPLRWVYQRFGLHDS
jgi:uncharacterized membrane protein YdfJ with MMPL/SSD domain